jgi:hypothetical protein
MGRTARLDKMGNSQLFLMKHEEKILQNSLKKFTINTSKPGKILLNFVENFNKFLKDIDCKEKITTVPQAYKDEVDENEKYRKKYIFTIFPLQKSIKDYLFKDKENLALARKAFKSSIRSYVVNHKWQKDVFNVKSLNLTRYVNKLINFLIYLFVLLFYCLFAFSFTSFYCYLKYIYRLDLFVCIKNHLILKLEEKASLLIMKLKRKILKEIKNSVVKKLKKD